MKRMKIVFFIIAVNFILSALLMDQEGIPVIILNAITGGLIAYFVFSGDKRIVHRCPKCKGKGIPVGMVFVTDPPKDGYTCSKCGYKWTVTRKY